MGKPNPESTDEECLQENHPTKNAKKAYDELEYELIRQSVSESRRNYNLSGKEIREILKRNFKKQRNLVSPTIRAEINAFLHWAKLAGFASPVFDLHPELFKRKSPTWKHLFDAVERQ